MWPGYQVVEVNRVGEDWVDFFSFWSFSGQFARWPGGCRRRWWTSLTKTDFWPKKFLQNKILQKILAGPGGGGGGQAGWQG